MHTFCFCANCENKSQTYTVDQELPWQARFLCRTFWESISLILVSVWRATALFLGPTIISANFKIFRFFTAGENSGVKVIFQEENFNEKMNSLLNIFILLNTNVQYIFFNIWILDLNQISYRTEPLFSLSKHALFWTKNMVADWKFGPDWKLVNISTDRVLWVQVEPVATGAVAPEVGKLPVGKLENGEAAAVREPTKPAPRAKYQLEPVEANQKDIYTNIKQAVLDPFFHFFWQLFLSDMYFLWCVCLQWMFTNIWLRFYI